MCIRDSPKVGCVSIRDKKENKRIYKMVEDKKYPAVVPEEVVNYTGPTDSFLCPLDANVYGIVFGRFIIRNPNTNEIYLDIEPEEGAPVKPITSDEMRTIKYSFPKEFLKMSQVGTTVEFRVGAQEVKNFRMIERHYFRQHLLRSYDFTFGFCIPNSKNTWELIYTIPELKEAELMEIVKHPFETKSDSFYFVGEKLIMHHKAEYEYTMCWG
eukprot:TRINITY_DN4064_c0_g1_i15.p1 TRINITY_DN4064_c0_g1~~TRINITY_DN4064_c0_g1_i15.p1  ORF type:complete len:212 (-),score=58.21 TRINITY_DN4064_c0_g1_i15:138-773(-)